MQYYKLLLPDEPLQDGDEELNPGNDSWEKVTNNQKRFLSGTYRRLMTVESSRPETPPASNKPVLCGECKYWEHEEQDYGFCRSQEFRKRVMILGGFFSARKDFGCVFGERK